MAKTTDERVASEVKRLTDAISGISEARSATMDGLIKRIAFMRVRLEDMEADINENGVIEMFSQSEKTPPYERRRPTVDVYLSMEKNYQAAVRQLNELLPKEIISDGNELEDFGECRI